MACTFNNPLETKKSSKLFLLVESNYNRETAEFMYLRTQQQDFKEAYPNVRYIDGEASFQDLEKYKLIIPIPSKVLNLEIEKEKENYIASRFKSLGINIEFKKDNNLDSEVANVSGSNGNFVITYNPTYKQEDTIFHEAGHILVDLLEESNPQLIERGIELLKNTPLYNSIKILYPDLDDRRLNKEVLVTALGMEANKLFANKEKQYTFLQWVRNFFNILGTKLGLNNDAVKELANLLLDKKVPLKINKRVKIELERQKTLKLINNVVKSETTLLEDMRKAIQRKIDFYYGMLNEQEKKRNINHEHLKALEKALTEYSRTDTIRGYSKFIREGLRQTALLLKEIETIVDSIPDDIVRQGHGVQVDTIQSILKYNSTFELAIEIKEMLSNNPNFRKSFIEMGLMEALDNLIDNYYVIKNQTKQVAISVLAKNFSSKSYSKVLAMERDKWEREFNLQNKDRKRDKVFIQEREAFIKSKLLDETGRTKHELAVKQFERYSYLLQQANQDIGFMERMFLDGDAMNEELINMASELLDKADFDVMTDTNEMFKKALENLKNYEKYKNNSNQVEKFKNLIEDEVIYDPASGKLLKTGKKSRHLITEYYSAFEFVKKAYYDAYSETKETGDAFAQEAAYAEYLKFLRENTKSRYSPAYYAIMDKLSPKAKELLYPLFERRADILSKYKRYKTADGVSLSAYDANSLTDEEVDELAEIEKEIDGIKSIFNKDGTKKTEESLRLATEIQNYYKSLKDIYEDDTETAAKLFEQAKSKAEKAGKLEEFMAKNTHKVLSKTFWEKFKIAIDRLNGGSSAIKRKIKDLLAPYKTKNGYENVPDDIKREIIKLETVRHTDETGAFIEYSQFVDTSTKRGKALNWIKKNVASKKTPEYEAELEAKFKEFGATSFKDVNSKEFDEWFLLNHIPDFYNNKGSMTKNADGSINYSAYEPLSIWTTIGSNIETNYEQQAKKNWKLTRVKPIYMNAAVKPEEVGTPTDFWKNPDFKNLNKEELETYQFIENMLAKSEDDLPDWAKLRRTHGTATFIRLPSVRKTSLEQIGEEGFMSYLKTRTPYTERDRDLAEQNVKVELTEEKKKNNPVYGMTLEYNEVTSKTKDANSQFFYDKDPENTDNTLLEGIMDRFLRPAVDKAVMIATDEKGGKRTETPISFRYKLSAEEQSYDLYSIFLLNYSMSLNYKKKEEIKSTLELTLDFMKERTVVENVGTFGKGLRPIVDRKNEQTPVTSGGEGSNAYKAMKSMLEDRLYGIPNTTNAILNNLSSKILGYTGNVMLVGNYLSAGANYLFGEANMVFEGLTGNMFSSKNLANAHRFYWKDIWNGSILSDIGNRETKSLTNLLIEKFNVIGDWTPVAHRFASDTKLKSLANFGSLQVLTSSVEHNLQGMLMYAVLDNIALKNENGDYLDKDGNLAADKESAVKLSEAYEVVNGRLELKEALKDKATHSDLSDVVPMEALPFMVSRKVRELNAQLNGQYSTQKRAEIQRTFYGALMMALRKWMPRGIMQRYRGISSFRLKQEDLDEDAAYFNRATNRIEEGYYTTTLRFAAGMLTNIKRLKMEIITTEWAKLTDYEQHNIKRTLGEFMTAAVLFALAVALKNIGDDDEKGETKYYLAAFYALRLQKELITFINPTEIISTLKSPSVALTMLERTKTLIMQLLYDGVGVITGQGLEVYKSGLNRGKYKIGEDIKDLIPLVGNVDKNIEEALGYLYNRRSN